MATCPRCGDNRKLLKRSDKWLYCKRHGRVRQIRTPEYLKERKIVKYLTQETLDAMEDVHSFVPEHTRSTLINYIESGLPTGGFVEAVLTNNLSGAVGRADHVNSQYLQSIVAWVYNFAPSTCCGSEEKVKDWYKSFRSADAA